jgi:hypothetical protein
MVFALALGYPFMLAIMDVTITQENSLGVEREKVKEMIPKPLRLKAPPLKYLIAQPRREAKSALCCIAYAYD